MSHPSDISRTFFIPHLDEQTLLLDESLPNDSLLNTPRQQRSAKPRSPLREIPSSLNTAGPTHKKGQINTILKRKQKIPSSKEPLQNDECDNPRKRRKSMLPVIRNSEPHNDNPEIQISRLEAVLDHAVQRPSTPRLTSIPPSPHGSVHSKGISPILAPPMHVTFPGTPQGEQLAAAENIPIQRDPSDSFRDEPDSSVASIAKSVYPNSHNTPISASQQFLSTATELTSTTRVTRVQRRGRHHVDKAVMPEVEPYLEESLSPDRKMPDGGDIVLRMKKRKRAASPDLAHINKPEQAELPPPVPTIPQEFKFATDTRRRRQSPYLREDSSSEATPHSRDTEAPPEKRRRSAAFNPLPTKDNDFCHSSNPGGRMPLPPPVPTIPQEFKFATDNRLHSNSGRQQVDSKESIAKTKRDSRPSRHSSVAPTTALRKPVLGAQTKPAEFNFSLPGIRSRRESVVKASRRETSPDPHSLPTRSSSRALRHTGPSAQQLRPTVPIAGAPTHGEQRAAEREKFEIGRQERERELWRITEEERAHRELEEERAYQELRKTTIPKANEVPEWYDNAPKRK